MKSTLKVTAALLCILMLVSAACVFAFAADGGNVPDCSLTWSFSGDTLTFGGSGAMPSLYETPWSEYSGNIKTVVIGSGVTSVDAQTLAMSTCVQSYAASSPSFSAIDGVLLSADRKTLVAYPSCRSNTSYTIPSCVAAIGKEAFHSNKYLKKLTFADSVTQIGEEAFYGSRKIESLTLCSAVKTIGCHAFSYSAMKNITLSAELLTIGENAFYSCDRLLSIDIPSKVTLIEKRAFQKCSSLQTVSIPASVTEIGYEAFDDNLALTSITVDSGNANYCSVDGVLYNKAKTTLLKFPESKTTGDFTVPDGVTKIAEQAFADSELAAVTLPEGVTEIGDSAFSDCCLLASVELPDSLITVGSNAFASCAMLERLAVPVMLSNVGYGAFSACEALTTIVIRAAAKSLSSSLLSSFENLSAFEVEDGNMYFSAADGVLFNADGTELLRYPKFKAGTTYTVPDNVVKISDRAFFDTDIESVKLNLELQEIGACAFYLCNSLESIIIPLSVTEIGDGAVGFSRYGDRDTCVKNGFVIISAADSAAKSYAAVNGISFSYCMHELATETDFEAACTVGGYTACLCTDCGDGFRKNGTDALGHDLKRDTTRDKAANCDKAGVEGYTCARCNAADDKTVKALGHNFKRDTARDRAATCNRAGVEAYTCTRCNATDGKAVKASGHEAVTDKAVAATCTASGLTSGSHCSQCGAVIVAQNKIKALPHTDADKDLLCDSCKTCIIDSAAVTGLRAVSSTSTTVKLKWNRLSGAAGYKIYKYSPESKSYKYYKTTSSTAFTDKGLESNKAFYYKVRAYKTIENNDNDCLSALSGRVKTYTAPAKVTGVKAAGYTAASLKLSWKKQASVTGYAVYKYNASTKKWELCKTVKTNTPSCTITKLKAGTAYKFTVKAYRTAGGKSYYSDSSTALTVPTKPSAPVLKGTASTKSARLSWSKVKGASSYSVYMYDAATKSYKLVGKTTSPEFTKTKLASGKSYCFKIKAYNSVSGYSGYSNAVKIKIR